jgi:hypothetical protein
MIDIISLASCKFPQSGKLYSARAADTSALMVCALIGLLDGMACDKAMETDG